MVASGHLPAKVLDQDIEHCEASDEVSYRDKGKMLWIKLKKTESSSRGGVH